MKAVNELKWLFMDLNSYFVSVEQQENPALRGKPVAVIPTQSDYTCVIAASYEAKAYGIRTGTKVGEAKEKCPHLICIDAQHNSYVAYHNRIIEVVSRHTPINKICSIDEISSVTPPAKRNIYDAQKIAQKIRNSIWEELGASINCSIGIGSTPLLAKIAADMRKPNGFTIIPHDKILETLSKLPLSDIPGIGYNMSKRLYRAHILNIPDFWNISPKHARKIWGNVAGEKLWYMLHGYEVDEPATSTVMIGHSRVLDPDLRDMNNAHKMARRLLEKACIRLRSKNMYAQRISIALRTTCHHRFEISQKTYATHSTFFLLHTLDEMWKNIAQQSLHISDLKVKKISIILHDLLQEHEITEDLFKEKTKQHKLDNTLDSLKHKYKKDVISFGLPPKTLSGFVGTKIAFSRVPEQHEFYE